MKLIKYLAATAAIMTLSTGLALAEPAATQATAASKVSETKSAHMQSMHKSKQHASVRSEASKVCSAQADAKQLHGKERKAFRKACMKDEKKSASISPASALKAKIATQSVAH